MIEVVAQPQSAGDVLRSARQRAGLSQAALAARSGVSQSVISVYEAGRRQPSLPTLANLVEAAGCDLELRVRPRSPRDRLRGPLGRRLFANRRQVREVMERQGVRLLGVFGSVSRGEDTASSDVDLLVTVPQGVGLIGLGRVEQKLSQLLSARVELVPADGLKPGVRKNVLADLVVL
jgi:predicted nucleotidyltransferase/DNA-binding XRE family transcriptional regulator